MLRSVNFEDVKITEWANLRRNVVLEEMSTLLAKRTLGRKFSVLVLRIVILLKPVKIIMKIASAKEKQIMASDEYLYFYFSRV